MKDGGWRGGERQTDRLTDWRKERGRESDRQRENSELDTLLPKDRDFRQWPVLTICLAKLHRYIKMIITLSTLARWLLQNGTVVVTWCFTPSQPLRLCQGEYKTAATLTVIQMTIRTTKLLSQAIIDTCQPHWMHTYCYRRSVLERQKDREERLEKDTERGEERHTQRERDSQTEKQTEREKICFVCLCTQNSF